ncbi:hypothetical protein [Garicola koreensis]|uniref:Uncharacterized protein n=1 Tax=Garicola koreensis TaxID=1262554 RepID=A0A7W5XJM8_9MICC|nr:hypothetical protein [Garicola koreensis]MBB3666497.1 hypothetical protein [Garicola koreensis]
MAADSPKPARGGHRRVTAPGTSGQPEEQEADVRDPLQDPADSQDEDVHDGRDEWLKAERPPHW